MSRDSVRIALAALTIGFGSVIVAQSAGATTIQVDAQGKLTGARGVDVDGVLFDVQFVDGTCAGVFGFCGSAAFYFQDSHEALDASAALLEQVFTGFYTAFPDATSGCSYVLECLVLTPFATRAVTLGPFTGMSPMFFPGTAIDIAAVNNLPIAISTSPNAHDNYLYTTYYDSAFSTLDTSIPNQYGNDNLVWAVWSLEPSFVLPPVVFDRFPLDIYLQPRVDFDDLLIPVPADEPVPEPGSMLLIGACLGAGAARRWFSRRAGRL